MDSLSFSEQSPSRGMEEWDGLLGFDRSIKTPATLPPVWLLCGQGIEGGCWD